jgi:cytochrome c oxidase subunit 2
VGTYLGSSAELCGQHHAPTLFHAKVIEQDMFYGYTDSLVAEGDTGVLSDATTTPTKTFRARERPSDTKSKGPR